MQYVKFYALTITLTMLVCILFSTLAISLKMNSVIIKSSGQISLTVWAKSGYWKDIKDAVDMIAAYGGVGKVYIPEGVWDFVNVNESWSDVRVEIPAGISIFGAPTERYSNGQVIQWKTVLRLPWDVPGSWLGGEGEPPAYGGPETPIWFKIVGNGSLDKPSRFSDIKLVGYRSIDPNSKMVLKGLRIENVVDFRVDHCCFEHIAGGAITTFGDPCRGVIDHCVFVNPVGTSGNPYSEYTVGYGVAVYRGNGDLWEDDITKVLGKYTNYTVFIEDCYFSGWRHCVAANKGAHYVFRYSTIENDFGMGSLDAHGWGVVENGQYVSVGTRAIEIYGNVIVNATQGMTAVYVRGGAGVAFNNTVGDGKYCIFLGMSNEAEQDAQKCWVHDWWIWNNTMLISDSDAYWPNTLCKEIHVGSDYKEQIVEGRDYFTYNPQWYTPYPYPHPLTLKKAP